jgi:hypothetical protein
MMATALIENRPTLTAPDPSFSPAGAFTFSFTNAHLIFS